MRCNPADRVGLMQSLLAAGDRRVADYARPRRVFPLREGAPDEAARRERRQTQPFRAKASAAANTRLRCAIRDSFSRQAFDRAAASDGAGRADRYRRPAQARRNNKQVGDDTDVDASWRALTPVRSMTAFWRRLAPSWCAIGRLSRRPAMTACAAERNRKVA